MTKFKVGDWVEFDNSVFCVHKEYNGNRYISEEVANNLANYGKSVTLWHPKEGEWCWFWDDITAHRPTLRKFGCVELPQYCADNAVFWDSEQNPFTNCAPFIGELPSFLKEHQCNQLT